MFNKSALETRNDLAKYFNAVDQLITIWWSEEDMHLLVENQDLPTDTEDWLHENAARVWLEFTQSGTYDWVLDRAMDLMRETLIEYVRDAHKGETN
jgi:hypothetical protein